MAESVVNLRVLLSLTLGLSLFSLSVKEQPGRSQDASLPANQPPSSLLGIFRQSQKISFCALAAIDKLRDIESVL